MVAVTIGLCTKNAAATIRAAVLSILNQDFPHELLEIVVVDGYSRDGTLQIINDEFARSDLDYITLQQTGGLGQARQMVVERARGDYIVWVDGDMVLSADFVRSQVEFMERNPSVGIGKGKYQMRDDDSLVASLENLEFVLAYSQVGITFSKTLATSGCIYRVTAIREAGGFDENIRGVGEDMDAEHRVRSRGWLLCITSATFYENRRKTWRALWEEYSWHGSGGHSLYKKNRQLIDFYKAFPPIGLAVQITRALKAYKLTHRRIAFLLPLHHSLKRVAWAIGFARSCVLDFHRRRA